MGAAALATSLGGAMAQSLSILDLRADLARLPRQPGAVRLDRPLRPASLTFHFSDVIARDRSPAAERRRLTAEAQYQLRKDWNTVPGAPPIFGSRYMYHYVVFTDGQVGVCNDLVQLWHCGNAIGNASSISTHVMLGRGQKLSTVQREALYALWDMLRAEHAIPRHAVYGHCEWPRHTGPARPSPIFAPLPLQSTCPERTLHRDLAAYRARDDDAPAGELYRALEAAWVRPSSDTEGAKVGELAAGQVVRVRRVVTGELVTHRRLGTSDEWGDLGYGFVWLNQLRKVAA